MKKTTWKIIIFFWIRLWIYQRFHQHFTSIFNKKSDHKVFCIGHPKTGTSSLYKALKILGYRTVRLFDGIILYKGEKERYIPKIKKSKYDAYVDYPMGKGNLYQEIDKAIPNSKFILTIRDKKSLEKSYKNFYKNAPFSDRLLKDLEIKISNVNERNKQITEYFKDRPSQLLIMNIIEGDGWEKLCDFLNKPIPNKCFPHKNIGKYAKKDGNN